MNTAIITYIFLIGLFGFIFAMAKNVDDIPEMRYIILIPLTMAVFGLLVEITNGVKNE